MGYLTGLEWMRLLDQFTPEQQKILLALSHDKYRWRTRDRLLEVTGLNSKTLDSNLSKLINLNFIRPSISKKKNIIFGLKERVD
jgi:RIO-like serine/threonine protein kinase